MREKDGCRGKGKPLQKERRHYIKKKEKRKRRWKIPGLKVEDKETEGLKRERERNLKYF